MAAHQSHRHRLRPPASAGSRRRRGISHALRHGPRRAHRRPRSTCAAPIPRTTSTSPRRASRNSSGLPITPRAKTTSSASPRRPARPAIEAIDEPGGGKRVRLTEPNGYQIEVVHGIADAAAPIATKRQKLNTGEAPLSRAGELMRLPKGPSHVKRIGARRADDAEVSTRRWAGSARCWASSARTTSMRAKRTI